MLKKLLILILILALIAIIVSITKAEKTYKFGSYYQTYEVDGAKSPIVWYVLDETDDAILLLSKYCLDAQRFGSAIDGCIWRDSDLREFLNGYFFETAFTEAEQQFILKTTVITTTNYVYPTSSDTHECTDRVFVLSLEEVEKYLVPARLIAYPTQFALIGHMRIIGDRWSGAQTGQSGAVCWWLRTTGITHYYATFIGANGTICTYGEAVYAPHYAVRPAMWIDKRVFGK